MSDDDVPIRDMNAEDLFEIVSARTRTVAQSSALPDLDRIEGRLQAAPYRYYNVTHRRRHSKHKK